MARRRARPGRNADLDAPVAAVRRFNRFYTRRIGVLERGFLKSPFSLAEVRVLYELAHRDAPTAADVARDLGLDPGYLSRLMRHLVARSLVERRPSGRDGRRQHLRLTGAGRRAFAELDRRQTAEVRHLVRAVDPAQRTRLTGAMQAIEQVLGATTEPAPGYLLRPPHPGDLGWVVHRHGALYAQEYGYDERFEALVAQIVADFVAHARPRRERCWIAERDGAIVGSVFLVHKSPTVAQLRLLLVEPSARGLGIGRRLVDECIRFARQAGYRRMVLWTQSELLAARHIYEAAGFHLTAREPHDSFGRRHLVAETWELTLDGPRMMGQPVQPARRQTTM
jgi:DNA-binding MarR family transcriptional regulator/N-acetylglutamate synthase-like GNAT family acetyltransferase